MGREAEYPVVLPDGSMGSAETVLRRLAKAGVYRPIFKDGVRIGLEGPQYALYLEVGRGTIEVVSQPCRDLWQLAEVHREASAHIAKAASASGQFLLGFGVQPVTRPAAEHMVEKPHYRVLDDALGGSWRWFQLTAGDQLHVDVARDELIAVLNLANRLVPVVIALCGNSPIVEGVLGDMVCRRESGLKALLAEPTRHGLLPEIQSVQHLIEVISAATFLFERSGGEYVPVNRAFSAWATGQSNLGESELLDAYLLHDHYNWHSCRLRAAYSTVELRSACQQPPDEDGAAAALYLAIVEGWRELAALDVVQHVDTESFYRQALCHGLELPSEYLHLIASVLSVCRTALQSRGLGEETLLLPLEARLARRENPGQRARSVFKAHGIDGLLAHFSAYVA